MKADTARKRLGRRLFLGRWLRVRLRVGFGRRVLSFLLGYGFLLRLRIGGTGPCQLGVLQIEGVQFAAATTGPPNLAFGLVESEAKPTLANGLGADDLGLR